MKKKVFITFIIAVVVASTTYAQSEDNACSVSSGGGCITKENYSFSYSIGELYMSTDLAASVGGPVQDDINTLTIFPNPSSGIIRLEFNSGKNGEIKTRVYNLLGQEETAVSTDSKQVIMGSNSETINLTELNNGIYLVETMFTSENGTSARTINKINLTK